MELYYLSKVHDCTTNNFSPFQRFNHCRRPNSGTELSLLARWRGEQTVPHCIPSSLFIVGIVFLILVVSFIQRTHLFVSLSTTFAPSQSITQLCLSTWSVIADLCSMLVEPHLVSRVKRLVGMVSTSFLCSSSLGQMFFLFHRCNT